MCRSLLVDMPAYLPSWVIPVLRWAKRPRSFPIRQAEVDQQRGDVRSGTDLPMGKLSPMPRRRFEGGHPKTHSLPCNAWLQPADAGDDLAFRRWSAAWMPTTVRSFVVVPRRHGPVANSLQAGWDDRQGALSRQRHRKGQRSTIGRITGGSTGASSRPRHEKVTRRLLD